MCECKRLRKFVKVSHGRCLEPKEGVCQGCICFDLLPRNAHYIVNEKRQSLHDRARLLSSQIMETDRIESN